MNTSVSTLQGKYRTKFHGTYSSTKSNTIHPTKYQCPTETIFSNFPRVTSSISFNQRLAVGPRENASAPHDRKKMTMYRRASIALARFRELRCSDGECNNDRLPLSRERVYIYNTRKDEARQFAFRKQMTEYFAQLALCQRQRLICHPLMIPGPLFLGLSYYGTLTDSATLGVRYSDIINELNQLSWFWEVLCRPQRERVIRQQQDWQISKIRHRRTD